jgi:hypothetical protein
MLKKPAHLDGRTEDQIRVREVQNYWGFIGCRKATANDDLELFAHGLIAEVVDLSVEQRRLVIRDHARALHMGVRRRQPKETEKPSTAVRFRSLPPAFRGVGRDGQAGDGTRPGQPHETTKHQGPQCN